MEETSSKEDQHCAGCFNNINDDDYVCALGQSWHKECFRCSVCDAPLTSWYFEKSGLLFCRSDYWARYGHDCLQCAQVITGPVMAAGEHKFHPECFACVSCSAHIEDGQPYALVDRSKLYCGSCYEAVGGVQVGGVQVGGVQVGGARGGVVRGVRAPARALRLAPSRDALTVTGIDSSCGLLTLHIGDRILEINGTPVKNKPFDEIDNILSMPDAVLQLTIEQTPETTFNNNNIQPPSCNVTDSDEKQKHDTKSPVERKLLREDLRKQLPKENIPEHRDAGKGEEDVGGRKERLFKRKGEEGGKGRVLKRRQTLSSPLLGDKEKSSSMSKLLDVVEGGKVSESSEGGVLRGLSRARSFRRPDRPPTVFRPPDLLQGELLGSGFFGQVYKVTHRETKEVMVLKQLYRVDDDAQRNFLKEVAVLRSLWHRNVLRFVGVLYRDRRLHLVTEYVAGGTLHQLLQDTNIPLSWEDRAKLARDVAAGVGYLHRMQVIHRDLNSHNCLVREDKTVIVADFGLARIVRRCGPVERKRYTVVGNPYWMAPEMMNGNEYDEKVDMFSFGIILCEIIGRVSADPDELPRRADFGLHEAQFEEKFCRHCPPALYRAAERACRLLPDRRPSFEVMENWLERLIRQLQHPGSKDDGLLEEIMKSSCAEGCSCEQCCTDGSNEKNAQEKHGAGCPIVKSQSHAAIVCDWTPLQRLGKCVSAGQLSGGRPGQRAPGYILRAHGTVINITKVDDISQWLECPTLKRPPASRGKLRRQPPPNPTPAFLRNQSEEGLQSDSIDYHPTSICRHHSVPDSCECNQDSDSDSSTDDEVSPWTMEVDKPTNFLTDIVKKGESLLSKKSSYDVANVTLRNTECLNERKIPEVDYRRHNIEHLMQNPSMAEGVKNLPKTVENQKQKSSFFAKKLLSPKLSRLFRPNTAEVVRNKEAVENNQEKSKSKFFVQRPLSPSALGRSRRVRPKGQTAPPLGPEDRVLDSDLKLASLGKPMTPIFRRHIPTDKPSFNDGRFSCREPRRSESKFLDISKIRSKDSVTDSAKLAPLIRCSPMSNIPALNTVLEKKGKVKEEVKKPGISRSNYVSLANLKINGKPSETQARVGIAPPERAI